MKEIIPNLQAIRRPLLWAGLLVALLVCPPAHPQHEARDNRAETRYFNSQDDDYQPVQRNDSRNDSRNRSRSVDRQDNSTRSKSADNRHDRDYGRQPSYDGGYYDSRASDRSRSRHEDSYNSRSSNSRTYDERYDVRYDTSVDRTGGQRRNDNQGGARIDSSAAARAVERATGGRVLSVDQAERNGRVQYRVKVLLREGRVKTMTVDGQTGAVGG